MDQPVVSSNYENKPQKAKLSWVDGLFALIVIALVVDFFLIFLWVPKEAMQGNVQRIFYLHVPAAWVAYIAFLLVFICSIFYLRNRHPRWDRYAHSAAELGMMFTSVNIITGIIWAKPIFGVWWVWDARLTTTALLWLIYIGYLMVGSYSLSQSKAANLRSAVGILGFAVVPINYLSVRLWDTVHVEPIIAGGDESYLSSKMLFTLIFSVATFTLMFVFLFIVRSLLRRVENDSDQLSILN